METAQPHGRRATFSLVARALAVTLGIQLDRLTDSQTFPQL